MTQYKERFKSEFDQKSNQRKLSGVDVVLHCHQHNTRLHKMLEDADQDKGKTIIRSAAEIVFSSTLKIFFKSGDNIADKWGLAKEYYSQMGYGDLDFSRIKEGIIESGSSHFVEGWRICFPVREDPVCCFTEGYIQGVYYAVTGQLVNVREKECMISGADKCTFEIDTDRQNLIEAMEPAPYTLRESKLNREDFVKSNIDENKIHEALAKSSICGNEKGLIPAFGVLMTNAPADYYNLINIQYIEEMEKLGLTNTAKNMLELSAENCAMNTFRCILYSKEWDELLAPMVKNDHDKLSGLITIINNLGWGAWHIEEHTPGESLKIVSDNSYTGLGYLKWRGYTESSKCFCHTGFSAGIMQLIYGEGTLEQRFGTFISEEHNCVASNKELCAIQTEKV